MRTGLVDGGIHRGTDVLKALALGATAVLVGRPYLYALAAGGSDGVASCMSILRRELQMAMALNRPDFDRGDRSVGFTVILRARNEPEGSGGWKGPPA